MLSHLCNVSCFLHHMMDVKLVVAHNYLCYFINFKELFLLGNFLFFFITCYKKGIKRKWILLVFFKSEQQCLLLFCNFMQQKE